MRHEFSLDSIKGIQDGALIYDSGSKTDKIDIRKSAHIWWSIHKKPSLLEFILNGKIRNKYAGDKCFNFVKPYIRLYSGEDEIFFYKIINEEFDTSDACELHMWWDKINSDINKLGYCLFDEG